MRIRNPQFTNKSGIILEEEGETIERQDTCLPSTMRRVAALLDLDQSTIVERSALPRGWHFPLLAADTRRSLLREDCFPGLGVLMPELGLPRLLLAARVVRFSGDIPVGATVDRTSSLARLERKSDGRGTRAVATIVHVLRVSDVQTPVVTETQTYLLLPAARFARVAAERSLPAEATAKRPVVVDATMLFQYSALCFNSHRIHVDRDYARECEGFPDLVVNGGLTTLLLTEFARRDLGILIGSIRLRYVAPLFADRLVTLVAERRDRDWRLQAYDDFGILAVDAEVETI